MPCFAANAGSSLHLRNGGHQRLSDRRCGKPAVYPAPRKLDPNCIAIHCQLTFTLSPGQQSHLCADDGHPSGVTATVAAAGATDFTRIPTPSAASQLHSPFQRAAAEAANAHGLVRLLPRHIDGSCLGIQSWHAELMASRMQHKRVSDCCHSACNRRVLGAGGTCHDDELGVRRHELRPRRCRHRQDSFNRCDAFLRSTLATSYIQTCAEVHHDPR